MSSPTIRGRTSDLITVHRDGEWLLYVAAQPSNTKSVRSVENLLPVFNGNGDLKPRL